MKKNLNKITRNDFKKGNFVKRVNKRDQHPILIFLKKNRGHAFTLPSIAKATKYNEDTSRSMLRVLIKDGLVDHKTPYFIFKK